jgi:hypothetical protein
MAVFDEQARRIVEQAISETNIVAKVIVIPATKAYFGTIPRKIMIDLITMANNGKIGFPAIIIKDEVVSYGVPRLEDMKAALHKFTNVENRDTENEVNGTKKEVIK